MTENKKKGRPFYRVFKNLDRDEVEVLADLGATSPNFALQCHNRFDCDVIIIPVNEFGVAQGKNTERINHYLARLKERGMDMSRVKVLNDADEIGPVDLLVSFDFFGVKADINQAVPWFEVLLKNDSRLLVDIARGSGGFKALRPFGNTNVVAKFDKNGKKIQRVVLSVEPQETLSNLEKWRASAMELIGEDGFYREEGVHSFTFIPRDDTLIVTFDHLDIAMDNREDRKPWGYSYIESMGWSMLGVMSGGWTWYRDPWVSEEFIRLSDEGFFDKFKRVVFYGASMGGYAALAFSAASPGADVVVFSPQTTLDRNLVPWETRYRVAWDLDYSGEFGDGAEASKSANRVFVFYDPYAFLDNAHVKRMNGDNVERYRAPLMGHKVGSSFQRMGILQPLVNAALQGELDQDLYREQFAKRKEFRRYLTELVTALRDRGHNKLAKVVCEDALKRLGEDRFFTRNLEELEDK